MQNSAQVSSPFFVINSLIIASPPWSVVYIIMDSSMTMDFHLFNIRFCESATAADSLTAMSPVASACLFSFCLFAIDLPS